MKIIDRYITKEFLLPFFGCVILFLSLSIIIDLFSRLEDVFKNSVQWPILLKYYLTFLPFLFVRTAPMSALLATLYVLTNLEKYNEITVLKASGLNIWRISLPLFFLGLFISMTASAINDKVVPQANLISTGIKEDYLDKESEEHKERTVENIAIYGTHNRLIHVRSFSVKESLLRDITILEQDKNEQVTSKIQAKQAKWEKDHWTFLDCVLYNYNLSEGAEEPAHFKKMLIDIEEKPKDFLRRESSAEFMSFKKLKRYIERLAVARVKIVQKLKVELYYKVSFPFVSLIIIFLGIPFALNSQSTGGGKIAGIGLCIIIAFCYYTVEALSLALGKRGTLPPLLSAWLANLLFSVVAVMLIQRSPK